MYQTFDSVFRAVPRQSLRARSKCDRAPGPPGAPVINGDLDREDVRRRVVGEGDLRAGGGNGEGDVRPVRRAAGAVVLVPALVDRDLALVRAGRQRGRLECVDAVAVDVLQPGPEAARVPVAGAAQLGLEAARGHGDRRAAVVGDPVALVVVVELDARGGWQGERDVVAVALDRVEPVVLGPGVVEWRLVLVVAGGQVVERALPDVVVGVVGEVGRRAGWIPVSLGSPPPTGASRLRSPTSDSACGTPTRWWSAAATPPRTAAIKHRAKPVRPHRRASPDPLRHFWKRQHTTATSAWSRRLHNARRFIVSLWAARTAVDRARRS